MSIKNMPSTHYVNQYGENALHQAARDGNLTAVKELVKNGHDINKLHTKQGTLPIFFAGESGNLELVEYLYEQKSSLCLQTNKNSNLLFWACSCTIPNKRNQIIAFILQKNIHEKILTPIQITAFLGNLQGLDNALKKLTLDSDSTLMLLICAAANNKEECFKLIKQKNNACFSLSIIRNFFLVKYNIEHLGSNPTEPEKDGDDEGLQLIHRAAYSGKLNIVKYLTALLQKKEPKSSNNPPAGHGPNEGNTPLWLATIKGHSDIVKYYIEECGVDPSGTKQSVVENNGFQLIHMAASMGHKEIVSYLVDQLANIEKNGNPPGPLENETPLSLATIKGHIEIVKYYHETCGIDPREKILSTEQKNNGSQLIHIAAINGRTNIVQYYIEYCKFDPCETMLSGKYKDYQLIHIAAINGKTDLVKYLTEILKKKNKNVNPAVTSSLETVNKQTPLWLATTIGYLDIVKHYVDTLKVDPVDSKETGSDQKIALLKASVLLKKFHVAQYFLENKFYLSGIKNELEESNLLNIFIASVTTMELENFSTENLSLFQNILTLTRECGAPVNKPMPTNSTQSLFSYVEEHFLNLLPYIENDIEHGIKTVIMSSSNKGLIEKVLSNSSKLPPNTVLMSNDREVENFREYLHDYLYAICEHYKSYQVMNPGQDLFEQDYYKQIQNILNCYTRANLIKTKAELRKNEAAAQKELPTPMPTTLTLKSRQLLPHEIEDLKNILENLHEINSMCFSKSSQSDHRDPIPAITFIATTATKLDTVTKQTTAISGMQPKLKLWASPPQLLSSSSSTTSLPTTSAAITNRQ